MPRVEGVNQKTNEKKKIEKKRDDTWRYGTFLAEQSGQLKELRTAE